MSSLEEAVKFHVKVDEKGNHIVQNTEQVEEQLRPYPKLYQTIKEGFGVVINYMDQSKEEMLR